ncbi:MAG: dihydropteroate synthase [Candidatus Eisenbacteria bacterium]
MQQDTHYGDLLGEIRARSRHRSNARSRGVTSDQIVVDPGIGFGKDLDQNLELLGAVPALAKLDRPVLIGASRKSFLGRILDSSGASGRGLGECTRRSGPGRGPFRAGSRRRRHRGSRSGGRRDASGDEEPPDGRFVR